MSKQKALQLLEARKKATSGEWSCGHPETPTGIESSAEPSEWVVSPCDDYNRPTKIDADFIIAAANEIESVVNWALTLEKQRNELVREYAELHDEEKMIKRLDSELNPIAIDSIKRGE